VSRYPVAPAFRRPALAPGIIGAIALLAGTLVIGLETFTIVLYVTSILAVIMAIFAWQGTQRLTIIPLALIAVLWNPVFPFAFDGPFWLAAQFVAALVMVLAGVVIRVPVTDAESRAR
jgi:hypothetical protein